MSGRVGAKAPPAPLRSILEQRLRLGTQLWWVGAAIERPEVSIIRRTAAIFAFVSGSWLRANCSFRMGIASTAPASAISSTCTKAKSPDFTFAIASGTLALSIP